MYSLALLGVFGSPMTDGNGRIDGLFLMNLHIQTTSRLFLDADSKAASCRALNRRHRNGFSMSLDMTDDSLHQLKHPKDKPSIEFTTHRTQNAADARNRGRTEIKYVLVTSTIL